MATSVSRTFRFSNAYILLVGSLARNVVSCRYVMTTLSLVVPSPLLIVEKNFILSCSDIYVDLGSCAFYDIQKSVIDYWDWYWMPFNTKVVVIINMTKIIEFVWNQLIVWIQRVLYSVRVNYSTPFMSIKKIIHRNWNSEF